MPIQGFFLTLDFPLSYNDLNIYAYTNNLICYSFIVYVITSRRSTSVSLLFTKYIVKKNCEDFEIGPNAE